LARPPGRPIELTVIEFQPQVMQPIVVRLVDYELVWGRRDLAWRWLVEVVFELVEWMAGNAAELEIRRQFIGRSSVMVTVDDCQAIYERWRANGVTFDQPPTVVPYSIQALAHTIDGNSLVVVQAPQS
jgi:hypothetical protein